MVDVHNSLDARHASEEDRRCMSPSASGLDASPATSVVETKLGSSLAMSSQLSDSAALRRELEDVGGSGPADDVPSAAVRNGSAVDGSGGVGLPDSKRATGNASAAGGGSPPPPGAGSGGAGSILKDESKPTAYTYNANRVIGNGSFGIVYHAHVVETNEKVAIKKVFQDRRYKNRELQIMKQLQHPNVIQLKHAFYTSGDKPDELFLNVVMEYVPETVYRAMKYYAKLKQRMPMIFVKLYAYQLCRSLAHTHYFGICHRDIKPQNLLVESESHVLKLCDFGSAKKLHPGEPNVAYICSRYYRAPELIFGSTDYTTAIDIWSMGCVIAEMILGQPLFPGESGVDQLVEIIKVLGTPGTDQLVAMNPNYRDFKFPLIKPLSWTEVFGKRSSKEAVDLIRLLLQYDPKGRLKPIDALAHEFFDELRDPNTRLPNSNNPLPNLFDFTKEELAMCSPSTVEKIIPWWYKSGAEGVLPP